MDHENGDFGILGLVEHVGVKVVNFAVFDGGVRHLSGMANSVGCLEYENGRFKSFLCDE